MKTVVCYGDSNTWGADPAGSGRFPPARRWTGVLARELGDGFRVVEEGLNGRTTVHDDPLSPHRNGLTYLPPCLESHAPLDLVTIMLGTNDLKRRFALSASDIAEGAGLLARLTRLSGTGPGGGAPRVLLIAPPPVATLTDLAAMFEGADEKSRAFAAHYRRVAGENRVDFFEAGSVIASSEVDGIHFDAGEHAKLGAAVAAEIRRVIAA